MGVRLAAPHRVVAPGITILGDLYSTSGFAGQSTDALRCEVAETLLTIYRHSA